MYHPEHEYAREKSEENAISPSSLSFMLNWLIDHDADFRYISFVDKTDYLSNHGLPYTGEALPLTTLTIEVTPSSKDIKNGHDPNPMICLVTSFGKDVMTKDMARMLSQNLSVSVNTIKAAKRNQQANFDPTISLGLPPGIISPFVYKGINREGFTAWYIKNPIDGDALQPIEVATSENSSLFVSRQDLLSLFSAFEQDFLQTPTFTYIDH